jgi:hypothetical protein
VFFLGHQSFRCPDYSGFLFIIFSKIIRYQIRWASEKNKSLQKEGWKSRPLVNADAFLLTNRGSEAFLRFQVSGASAAVHHS